MQIDNIKSFIKCKNCGIKINAGDFCFECWNDDYRKGCLIIISVMGFVGLLICLL